MQRAVPCQAHRHAPKSVQLALQLARAAARVLPAARGRAPPRPEPASACTEQRREPEAGTPQPPHRYTLPSRRSLSSALFVVPRPAHVARRGLGSPLAHFPPRPCCPVQLHLFFFPALAPPLRREQPDVFRRSPRLFSLGGGLTVKSRKESPLVKIELGFPFGPQVRGADCRASSTALGQREETFGSPLFFSTLN